MKLYQLGKNGQYFSQEIITPDKNKDDKKLQAIKLQFLKGFRFTLTPIKSKVYLRVDYCSRVLQ